MNRRLIVSQETMLAYRREFWRMLSTMPGASDWEKVRLLYNAGYRWY